MKPERIPDEFPAPSYRGTQRDALERIRDAFAAGNDVVLVRAPTGSDPPDGVESFEITVTLGEQSERATIQTSECYGDLEAEIDRDGTLDLGYAVC